MSGLHHREQTAERGWRHFQQLWPWSLCLGVAVLSVVLVERLTPETLVPDFTSYYFAAIEAADGGNIYNAHGSHRMYPYMYPPFFAIALRPLTWLSLESALVVWSVLHVALAAVALWLTSKILRRFALPTMWPVVLSAVLGTWVFILNLLWGQVNVLVIVLALLAVWLMLTSRALLAGVVLGVAVSIKVTPVCILLVVSLMRPRDMIVTVTACVATVFACCLLVPALFVDLGWALSMNQHFLAFSQQSVSGAVAALPFGNNVRNQSLTFGYGATMIVLPLLAAAVTAWAGLRSRKSTRTSVQPIVVAQAFVVMPLISPVAWGHHWFALLPSIAIATALRGRARALRAAWLFLALAVVGTFLVDDFPAVVVATITLVAAVLLAVAATAAAAETVRSTQAATSADVPK